MQMNFFSWGGVRFKWVVLGISVLISFGSIYYTNILVRQLREREREQVRLFAKAIESTLADEGDALSFVSQEIITRNNSIPTIYRNAQGQWFYRNIDIG